jgi:polar amino acid transport system substrate-binding protein
MKRPRPCDRGATALRGLARALLAVALALCLAGCRYPQDVEGTLERVQGGVLVVGATENPPWVIRTGDGAAGLEAELVTGIAEALGAEVHWRWGREGELLGALAEFQLDVVIGGLVKKPPLGHGVALTNPYFKSRATVGFPGEQASLPSSLEGLEVGVLRLHPLHRALRERGAKPLYLDDSIEPGMPVAHATWWLRAHGYAPGRWELAADEHVMALPPGENAWMMTVQQYLDSARGLEQRLQEWERQR